MKMLFTSSLKARNKYKMNPYYALGWQMLIGSFLIFIAARLTGNNIPFNEIPMQTWVAIAYLISMGSIIAFVAFIYSIKHLPPAIASLYAYINPVVAMVTGTFLLDEPLTLNLLIGAIITLGGVYLVNTVSKKQLDAGPRRGFAITRCCVAHLYVQHLTELKFFCKKAAYIFLHGNHWGCSVRK